MNDCAFVLNLFLVRFFSFVKYEMIASEYSLLQGKNVGVLSILLVSKSPAKILRSLAPISCLGFNSLVMEFMMVLISSICLSENLAMILHWIIH